MKRQPELIAIVAGLTVVVLVVGQSSVGKGWFQERRMAATAELFWRRIESVAIILDVGCIHWLCGGGAGKGRGWL
jgi:hypothetical protein